MPYGYGDYNLYPGGTGGGGGRGRGANIFDQLAQAAVMSSIGGGIEQNPVFGATPTAPDTEEGPNNARVYKMPTGEQASTSDVDKYGTGPVKRPSLGTAFFSPSTAAQANSINLNYQMKPMMEQQQFDIENKKASQYIKTALAYAESKKSGKPMDLSSVDDDEVKGILASSGAASVLGRGLSPQEIGDIQEGIKKNNDNVPWLHAELAKISAAGAVENAPRIVEANKQATIADTMRSKYGQNLTQAEQDALSSGGSDAMVAEARNRKRMGEEITPGKMTVESIETYGKIKAAPYMARAEEANAARAAGEAEHPGLFSNLPMTLSFDAKNRGVMGTHFTKDSGISPLYYYRPMAGATALQGQAGGPTPMTLPNGMILDPNAQGQGGGQPPQSNVSPSVARPPVSAMPQPGPAMWQNASPGERLQMLLKLLSSGGVQQPSQ